ncbi:MAG: c-type cytochrome [Anaerolineae bacterium]|nr:c-type cytochrome [Anaerolineae bacterium]
MIKTRVWTVLSIMLAVMLAGCGLASEPEIVQEIPLPTPAPTIVSPETPPDLAAGAAFYAAHCAVCHGAGGRGDGQMVRDGRLQTPPPSFADLATSGGQTPLDYMTVITDGNMLAGMPPFSSYNVQDRWNVAAYVFSGWMTAEQIAQGGVVYEANCASCHGDGTGNGPQAPEIMPDLTAPDYWAAVSNETLLQAISAGISPEMPGFADTLSEAEILAVTAYVRALAVRGTPGFPAGGETVMAEAQATATATLAAANGEGAGGAGEVAEAASGAEPEQISLTGMVINRSAGGTVPIGAPITLHMFDPPDFAETILEGEIGPDGTYRFENVPHVADRVYLLSLQYQDVFFSSTIYQLEDASSAAIETTVEIFETTNDPAALRFTSGVMRVTFSQFGMEVAEVLSITNDSDRLFLTDETISDNQRVALRIPLPPGAGGVGFEPGMQGTRFLMNEDETVILDTQPVRPGRDDIFFSYFIPYEDGAIIEQEVAYPFSGPFHLLIEAGQVTVSGTGFEGSSQPVDMGGRTFDAYVARLEVPAGGAISFTLSGRPQAASAGSTAQAGSGLSPLVIGLIVAGVLLIGVGGFLFLLRQGVRDTRQAAIDDLLEQIAALDDRHDRGEIADSEYQQVRTRLKARLARLMREQEAGPGEGGAA